MQAHLSQNDPPFELKYPYMRQAFTLSILSPWSYFELACLYLGHLWLVDKSRICISYVFTSEDVCGRGDKKVGGDIAE